MPPVEVLQSRIKRLRKGLKADGLDGMVVLDRTNTSYLTGFACSYSVLVIDAENATFVTDSRYGEAATLELSELVEVVVQPTTKVSEFIRDLFKKRGYERLGFEGTISFNEYENLKKLFRGAKLENQDELLKKLRQVKDDEELKLIRKAVRLADRVMAEAIDRIKPGMSEKDLSRQIRVLMEELGGEKESFSNIIASGPNSSRPHHHPGTRKFRKGDPITIDLGGVVGGYCSDLTRTPVLGKPEDEFVEIYNVCFAAHQAAIAALKPGMTGREVDDIARTVIRDAGFGDNFGHGLGHGVGLEIHEDPRLSPRAGDYQLQPGNIVTIEPGIYIPGRHGVRIEDYVLVTEEGCEVLSKSPRRLSSIN